ncbi:hypothetical protein HPB51_018105 [Rhipicephalus microplus]|uniref:Uncharacterized protein n=1 Tax=Rhipicephalus microplus TaxID=6941 RepID=A0A9J6E3F3_RHIMP|nr:hypothetical protein HPB51_018105 [Rhipicephalus microplus]
MPDQVQRYAELRLATNYEHFVHFFSHRVIFPQREDELMLGWHVVLHVAALTNSDLATLFHELIGGSKEPIWKHKKYCFDLTKKYMGLASIMHVSQQRFTNVVRSDVEAMARDVRRMYFSTLEQTTYDWKDLSRVLEFIDVVLSGNIEKVTTNNQKYCFDLTKKYMGLASIMHVSQQRFTNVVRSDVEAMARDVRRMYFSTLEQTTYDWKDLSQVLEFIDVVLSGNIEKVTTNNQVTMKRPCHAIRT